MQGYEGVRALAEAAREADGGSVADALAKPGSFSTFLGPLQFSGDHSLTYDDNVIARVQRGALTLQTTLRSTD
jgi:ABC-type branched-subunit amino acid transport system substrate-binding protein